MVIDAHGITIDLPHGWEGRIYRRPEGDPTLHAGTFALPAEDGDFGTRATELMPPGASFFVLTEYRPGGGLEPGRGLFAPRELPLPLDPARFRHDALLLALPGRAGFQHFFTHGSRPFCLYAVVRAHGRRRVGAAAAQATAIEGVLRSLRIEPRP
jgi:hypothetical protein